MANPKRDLPRAMEATILIVLVLYMGVALAVVMINFLSLTTVASLGGATTLLVYSLVNFSALRLLKDKGPHRILVILAAVACTISIVIWTVHAFKTSPHSLSIFVFFLAISFVAEWLLQGIKGRKIRLGAVNYGVRVKCQSGLTDIVGIVLLQVESKGRFQSGCDR